jgi:hypothetical protein
VPVLNKANGVEGMGFWAGGGSGNEGGNGVRASKVWRQLLGGVERTVIEPVELAEDEEGVIVVHVRPFSSATGFLN